jgi:hypothetical protein
LLSAPAMRGEARVNSHAARGRQVAPPRGKGKSTAVYGRGRVCAAAACATILSSYNPSTYCSLHGAGHEDGPVERPGTVRPEKEHVCRNSSCGARFSTPNPHRRYCSDRCRMEAFASRKHNVDSESHWEAGAL